MDKILALLQSVTDGVKNALSIPNLTPVQLGELETIVTELAQIEGMLQSNKQPMDPATLLNVMCAAIKDYEGWAAPGEELNGTVYVHGTPAYQNKNPGNLRCDPNNRSNWNVLATGTRGGFCVFPTLEIGLQAQKNVILAVASGKVPLTSPYQAYARKHGLTSCSELTLQQYMIVRDPASDNNDPDKYAAYIGQRMGVDYRTWQMKNLVA